MSQPESLFSVRDIHAGYGASTVLQGVSFDLQPGRIVAILGRNGVGKTTLVRAVSGQLPIRRGRVVLAGSDITGLAPYRIARCGVGIVPQGRRLFRSLSVREHLQVGARPGSGGIPPWTVERVIEQFPRIGERLSNLGGALSGGEQSMVAMARALVGNPSVLLLDEPSEGLSPLLVTYVANVLRVARDEGRAILLIEQNLGLATSVADIIHIMSKGQIVDSCSPEELASSPDIRTRWLGM